MFQKVYAVFFSPTGNTKVLTETLAEQLAVSYDVPCEVIDFTRLQARTVPENTERVPSGTDWTQFSHQDTFSPDDLVVCGMPTYAGKLPNKILPFVRSGFAGNGAAAAALVTFGNRSFDNALAELCACLNEGGFATIGAAAFAAQHAFAWDEKAPAFRKVYNQYLEHETADVFAEKDPTAAAGTADMMTEDRQAGMPGFGRPDPRDFNELKAFGKAIQKKITEWSAVPGNRTELSEAKSQSIFVPGKADAPYYTPTGLDGTPENFLKAKPKTDWERCNGCGTCAAVCPMGSIAGRDGRWETTGICIKCHACVKACPEGAKYFDDEAYLSHRAMLVRDYTKRCEPCWFV